MTYSTCEISKKNAREWAARASDAALRAWSPCGCEGCAYCDELVRARDERFAPKPPPPPVDRSAQTTTDGRTPDEVRAEQQADGNVMHKSYIVLTEAERAKGFVRPVRRSYKHVGLPPPRGTLRDLTEKERELYGDSFAKFEDYPESMRPAVGRFWTSAELAKINKACGGTTTMGQSIAETYARDPKFYGSTMCVTCGAHFPVGERGEFVWLDNPDERVGT